MHAVLQKAHGLKAELKLIEREYNAREQAEWDNLPDEDAWWSVIDGPDL